ncbi:2'-5' RNA ligase family protein [Chitinophaga silvatica]|uniref:2'-5' RNA ligase family protein n=1 Tax=Chitinophaga silvatica TaxID=2282649 RepID=A0A3E1Y6M1_9BACT|nr:2'-5' RNA ligase family protein [Chitinophaga silvatica]RFS20551.1 2'-5' RNA ligase family protein [Chitinophaga silvatica]
MNTNFEMSDTIYDYLIVINPDVLVAQDVSHIREYVAAMTGDTALVSAPVHIALFRSAFPERFQSDFELMLEETAKQQSGFVVYTAKMDAHRHAEGHNSVFVNIANPKPLIDLHRAILQTFELKPQQFKPHILLARGLGNEVSEQLMATLSQQMFVRSFNCHCFTLMRRPAEGGKYERVKDFGFGDVEHLPGSLFINNYAA